jgi:hypothetical protein
VGVFSMEVPVVHDENYCCENIDNFQLVMNGRVVNLGHGDLNFSSAAVSAMK